MALMRVVVVGAGIIGLAIAEELTRQGLSVELLEKSGEPGSEASSAAAGILSPQGEAKGPGPWLELLLTGYSLFPEAVARLESATGIDLKFRASGMLAVGFTEEDEREFNQEFTWQEKTGLRLERVSGSQVKELEPAVDGPVRCALWWPQTAQLDNVNLVQAYRRAVEKQGGSIRANRTVKRFRMEGDRVTGVETDQGPVKADWMVNCAGSWAGFDSSLPMAVPTLPAKGQMLEFRTEAPMVDRVVKSPRAYLVQRSPDRLIVGTTVERVGYDKAVTEEGRRSIRAGAGEITSRLNGFKEASSWAGLRPDTPDHLPILGPTPWKGLLMATGHFRNGILLAPLTGRLIAEWITTGRCSIDWAPFSLMRFMAKA